MPIHDPNEQCALQCEGYVRAGVAPNGTVWLHPPGERTRSVPVPAYTEDWHVCMRLVQRYQLIVQAGHDVQGRFWEVGQATWDEWQFCRTDADARAMIVQTALRLAQCPTASAPCHL